MILLTSFREYTDFLEDLEEDPTYRENVNIYKGKQAPCIVSLKLTLAVLNILLSYDVTSRNEITPCNEIDKLL